MRSIWSKWVTCWKFHNMSIIQFFKDHTFSFKMTPKTWFYLCFLSKLWMIVFTLLKLLTFSLLLPLSAAVLRHITSCYAKTVVQYILHFICVCMCMYACMYVCMHLCMRLHVYMYIWMYICMYTCMCVCLYACTYICMYVFMYVYQCAVMLLV